MSDDFGGWWTEAKLDVLGKYLEAFNVATRQWGQTVYLDLFGGKLENVRPDTGAVYRGSSARAMETSPAFTKLVFWELAAKAAQLRSDLATKYPSDSRATVITGDCNLTLVDGLDAVRELRNKPTFAFIDPKGLNVEWPTLEALSKWRPGNNKTELWILLPDPAMPRVLALDGVHGQNNADRITRLYGCDDWVAIHENRTSNGLTPEQARAEYVNLLRWRLETVLGYKHTHALGLANVNNVPVYTMVFATCNDTGNKIMRDIYEHASVHEIPALRAQAQAHRSRQKDEDTGVMSLFDMAPSVTSVKYEHLKPWKPAERQGAALTFDPEPG